MSKVFEFVLSLITGLFFFFIAIYYRVDLLFILLFSFFGLSLLLNAFIILHEFFFPKTQEMKVFEKHLLGEQNE